jgi:TPR repeat protein
MIRMPTDRVQRLANAWIIGLSPGDGMGLLWHLALRRYPPAMTELARRIGEDGRSAADPYSSAGLCYRALRQGDPTAAHNMAMTRFNCRDLQGYRHWLRLAAKAGDEEAGQQLRRFETRLPHGVARDIKRGRMWRAYD